MPTVRCPYCNHSLQIDGVPESGRVDCPTCNRTMVISRKTAPGTTIRHETVVGRGTSHQDRTTSRGTGAGMKVLTDRGTGGTTGGGHRSQYSQVSKGDVLGGFRIEEMIGAGAMAVVYEATQLSLGRRVALKILPQEFARRESFVKQFDSETELLASLNHPNIVTIIDRGCEGDTYYFAMELIEGTTLGELAVSEQIDEEFFLQIVEQCAEALTYAHSKSIIHRDIKPANIMLNEHGMVKVADFGVAGLIAGGEESGKRKVVGTRGYMPPEQEMHIDRTDERSDIFSLGAVMYRVLTGKIPDQLPPVAPSKLKGEGDVRLDHIVLKCLEASPKRRYQTAQEVLDAIQEYRRELSKALEVCPQCKKENPPSQMTCLHCGADLSDQFDECPECGAMNRMDMDLCMSCGTSLSRLRQETSVAISRCEERAREYVLRHKYDMAVEELEEILRTKGKIFEKARERARRYIEECREAEESHQHERIREARRLADEGHLDKAVRIIEKLPAAYADKHDAESLLNEIKFRMTLARKKVESIEGLLRERNFAEAERVLADVEERWPDCPGIDVARQQIKASRDTQRMLEYELSEVRGLLEEGKTHEARQALQFAQSTMADNPAVKELVQQIDQREKVLLARNSLKDGKSAFDEGRFSEAVRQWTLARDQLAEGDERRAKLEESIRVAKRRALEHDVVRLEEAQPVPLRLRRGALLNTLISGGICLGVAAAIALLVAIVAKLAL